MTRHLASFYCNHSEFQFQNAINFLSHYVNYFRNILSCLFGELFPNNCIKPHFLSNCLDITVNFNYLFAHDCFSCPMPSFSFVSFIPLNCTPQLSSPRKDGAVCPPGPWEIRNSVYFPSQWNDMLSGRGILVLKLAFLRAQRPVCQRRFQYFRLADGMTSTKGTFVLFAGNLFFFPFTLQT